MEKPWVTVICLCHNHAAYVQEALDSVLGQSWPWVQLIIVDDASTDGSQEVIRAYVERCFLEKKEGFHQVLIEKNEGNTRAFNRGLKLALGEYVIDLAADDVLLPDRVASGVRFFEALGEKYGVTYCNVELMARDGRHLRNFYPEVSTFHPSGDLFAYLLASTFISPPGMMMRREVFDLLNGYDEGLAYEDYDFWVRSSREFLYAYQNEVLVKKRELPDSFSKGFQDERSGEMLASTLKVCTKALALCRNSTEKDALGEALSYYLRQSALLGHPSLAWDFFELKEEIKKAALQDRFWKAMATFPLKRFYNLYRRYL